NVGVPMELLQYRPDVYAAELDLRRANAEVGVAQSYRYPSLNIDLTGGLDAMLGENWFQIPGSIFGSIAAGITQPIFNKRRLKTNFEVAKLERDKAEINFQRKILLGINEVSDALISMQKIDEQMTYIDRRVEVTQKTVLNAFLLFKSGLANYLEVLTAQSNAMESELDKVNLELQRRNERVNLYRSLGGGWQ
ncbi:MAG TPA: TolC family protein, partial [Candidatus Sphingobacterium stercoripullorum]|nr:TolC family protein [Candidatus Sphingobacterium stercoripullorum]